MQFTFSNRKSFPRISHHTINFLSTSFFSFLCFYCFKLTISGNNCSIAICHCHSTIMSIVAFHAFIFICMWFRAEHQVEIWVPLEANEPAFLALFFPTTLQIQLWWRFSIPPPPSRFCGMFIARLICRFSWWWCLCMQFIQQWSLSSYEYWIAKSGREEMCDESM